MSNDKLDCLLLLLFDRYQQNLGIMSFQHVRMGMLFESLVKTDKRFVLPVERHLSLVGFHLKVEKRILKEEKYKQHTMPYLLYTDFSFTVKMN
jgi:hypothetical protein